MSTENTITVVIPSKDRPELILRTIDSILAQSRMPDELIIVDDHSTRSVRGVVSGRLLPTDMEVRVIRNPSSLGAAASRNIGACEAASDLVAFSDDDCIWEPDKLACQEAALYESGADLSYCMAAIEDLWGHSRIVGVDVEAYEGAAYRPLLAHNFIAPFCVLVRRSAFMAVGGFDERLPAYEDWDLWLRMAPSNSFVAVPRVLVRTSVTEIGITADRTKPPLALEVLSSRHPSSSMPRGARADFLTACSAELAFAGHRGLALQYLARAARDSVKWKIVLLYSLILLFGTSGYRLVVQWRNRLRISWIDRLVASFWR